MAARLLIAADLLQARVANVLQSAGACHRSTEAAVKAVMHASLLGVDSHGVRLIPHYDRVLRGGRVNGCPNFKTRRTGSATAVLDGDNGLGHRVGYEAIALAVQIARENGVGAVGAIRSSHFGAAGAYARAAAEAGMIGFATTNADSAVTLFDGAEAFHGTNPLAFAAPSGGERPWLIDMATSSIPFNRVLLYRSLGLGLPDNVAADGTGESTRDPDQVRMLLPLGGADFSFKGAALAGVATVLSAVLQDAPLDHELIRMGDDNVSTPREMGHFFLAVDPARFAGLDVFVASMARYLDALRAVPGRPRQHPLAPGDREWQVEAERLRSGIPVDPDTAKFLDLAQSPAPFGEQSVQSVTAGARGEPGGADRP
jgi:ureidoglycolate dehydrogenase (NAD+)